MRNSVKTILVLFAVVMSLVAVQANAAPTYDTVTITGTVQSTSINDSTITVLVDSGPETLIGNLITINCIPLTYLQVNYGITFSPGVTAVSADVYARTLSDGTIKYIAVSLTVGDETISLPPKSQPQRGKN